MIRVALSLTAGYLLVADVSAARATTECQRVKGSDSSYWSWREIDGRRCWYRGRAGRPKAELHWALSSPRSSAATRDGVENISSTLDPAPAAVAPVSVPDPDSIAPVSPIEATRALTEDDLLAFTCCWPELTTSAPAAAELEPAITTAPPHGTSWPWGLLPIVVYIAYRLFGFHLLRHGETT